MRTEWWHFDARGWSQYPLMNHQLEDLAREADAAKEKTEATEEKPLLKDTPGGSPGSGG